MKIKTLFTLSTLLFAIVFIVTCTSLIYTYSEVNRLGQQQTTVLNVIRGAYELSYLSNDYLFHPEEQRQNIQWDSRFAVLSMDISLLSVNKPEQQMLIDRILLNKNRLYDVHTQSIKAIEASKTTDGLPGDPELINVAWSRNTVQTQAMIFDASTLLGLLHEESDQVHRINTILVFLLMVFLFAFLLTNYTFIKQRILTSLSDLNAGTKIIGGGNLDFRVDTHHDDEIGDLAASFNQMSGNLGKVTASKTDLEHEISERKLAEIALRDAHDNLEIQVRDRTAQLSDANRNLLAEMAERKKTEENLRKSEEKYRDIYENSVMGLFQSAPEGNIIRANDAFARMYGYSSAAELLAAGLNIGTQIYAHPETRSEVLRLVATNGIVENYETLHVKRDGTRFWVSITARVIRNRDGTVGMYEGTIIDITKRRMAEEAQQQSDERLRSILASMDDLVFTLDENNIFFGSYHQKTGNLFAPPEQFMGKSIRDVFPEELAAKIQQAITEVKNTGVTQQIEYSLPIQGKPEWYTTKISARYDQDGKFSGVTCVARITTGNKLATETIRHALLEKEILLREIHHRVKNNLTGIISLINLQTSSLTDPDQIFMLKDLETRIRSMVIVHESLYQTKDFANISLAGYTENLTRYLFQVYDTVTIVQCRIDMGDITMPIETATPCGLVMTEIITNSLKYAFPSTFSCEKIRKEPCTIRITMCREGSDYLLTVADNGIGLPEKTDVTGRTSLGLYLIGFIVKHQLRGVTEVNTGNGTSYMIRFPNIRRKEREGVTSQ